MRVRVRRLAWSLCALGLVGSLVLLSGPVAAVPPPAPVQIGFQAGDDWEPSLAADRFGHVYAFWTHYGTDPACTSCGPNFMELQLSSDGGKTWGQPRPFLQSGLRQDDPQIVVDPVDGKTVYTAFMQGNKSSQFVAKSTDFGATWNTVLVESLQRGTDKDILAVRGQDVYLAYNAAQRIFVSVSHDGGATWTLNRMLFDGSKFGWALPGGGAVDSGGRAFFAWEGFTQNGGAKGPVNVFVSRSTDGGATWTASLLDVSQAPPQCTNCGWAYWGPGTSLAVDGQDGLYVLWNANHTKYGPNRMYFSRSADHGATWSPPAEVSLAPSGSNNLFPAVTARGAGDVRIAWMDDRNGHDLGTGLPEARWNVYYRSSTTGGISWSNELQVSRFVTGYPYKLDTPLDGFGQPYGDYFEMDIDQMGRTHMAWGEGPNYVGPGNVWYANL
jgi:hypothetical protein